MLRNLEAERVRHQMTKAGLANLIGVSAKTYASYVAEKTPIPSPVLLQLARLFNCRLDYLLDATDERS